MNGMAEMHELGQLIDGTFGDYLIAFAGKRSMTTSTHRRAGKAGEFPRDGGRMASGASQLEWSVRLMAERTQSECQQKKAATGKQHSGSSARRESRPGWSDTRG